MIQYTDSLEDITPAMLDGFFVDWGWPSYPSPEVHQQILANSYCVWLAIDDDMPAQSVVGFITAISDGVLSAYIPLLEVRQSHQGHGIGSELVRRMLVSLDHLYMVDLMCEPHVQTFYARAGMQPAVGMVKRNYDKQTGHRLTPDDD